MADAKSESEFDKRLISTTFTTSCIKSEEHSVACGHSVNPIHARGTQEADPSSGTNSFCAWPRMIAALMVLPCIASLESCFAVA